MAATYTLVNIGNSFTQMALADAGQMRGECHRIPTESLLTADPYDSLWAAFRYPCLAACVVPAVRDRLNALAGTRDLRFLTAELIEEVDFSLVDPTTLGADRMANAVAAVVRGAHPVVVLDCGTCVTTEVLDADARLVGGAILPGRRLLRRALCDYTGQLPMVPESMRRPKAVGRCTEEAILAGVDLGILGSVERLIADSRAQLDEPDCAVLAAGGDAQFFCRHLSGVAYAGDSFTLSGLAAVGARLFQ